MSPIITAPCLASGPLATSGRALVAACDALGENSLAMTLRASCVPALFVGMEQDFAAGRPPAQGTSDRMAELAQHLAAFSGCSLLNSGATAHDEAGAVREVTGTHYGNLFKAFSASSYAEAADLLKARLERNGVPPAAYINKSVLDAGCGGGRYTVAWKQLGAGSATGVDASEIGVTDARRRVEEAGITGVTFDQGDVLDLPYESDSFDVVFSNGVLHHTTDWKTGVSELLRVLKPGGLGWLYLIENPGGVFWDTIEILRVITQGDSREHAREALTHLGMPANRIFYMLDHVMVPINLRLTAEEIIEQLQASGATNVRRLTRGTDFDRIESIHQGKPHAVEMFGAGENRFVFSK